MRGAARDRASSTPRRDLFEEFVEQVLAHKLRPSDIVVLDNVGAHKANRIRALVEAAEHGSCSCHRTRRT